MKVVGITVRLSKAEHARLQALAKAEHRTIAGELRKAVVDHLDRSEQRAAA